MTLKAIQKTAIAALGAVFPLFAFAADWTCRNNDIEITCTSKKCRSSLEFTPLSAGFNDRGSLIICAYSGCWEGTGKTWQRGNQLLLSGQGIGWTGADRTSGDFMIALDRRTGVAVLNGEGFAMPLLCSSTSGTSDFSGRPK